MTLIDHLIDQLQLSRQQAEGSAGLLLRQAQAKLTPEEFLQVAAAVPAISDLIGKAPRQEATGPGLIRAAWLRWFSGWGALAPLRQACEALGLDHPSMEKVAAETSSFFRKWSGVEVELLLQRAWR